ncbi:MAG: pilus assembly protein TadG-related protein [Pseudomonadota bacterium]
MKFDWGHLTARRQEPRATLKNSTALRCVAAFRRDEDGGGSLFSFYVTIMLLMLAGLGVDTMRQEMERTHLQATLDSAVLAGAGAPTGSDKQDVKDIVEDYFAKHQMSSYLQEIDIDGQGSDDIEISLNATRVYAEANMDIDTYLLQMTGVDQLRALGEAEAQVARPKLEISLVLDVSGSMQGTKLANLQTAANSFVTTMLTQSDPGDTFISLIPFAWTVTPGRDLFEELTVDITHDYSTCLRFGSTDYNTPAIDPDETQDLQIFTSIYGDFDDFNEGWRSCFAEARSEILPYSTSEADLHAHINGLNADGNTSAHIGMKWGAALLDPEFQEVVTGLQTANVVDSSLANIPAQYNEPETLKVVVLMADGRNTYSYYFDQNSNYRGPDSDLYRLTWQEMEFDYAWKERNRGGIRYSNNENKCGQPDWNCEYIATGEEFSAYYLYDDDQYLDIEGTGPINNQTFDEQDSPDVVSTGTPNGGSPTWVDEDVFEEFEDHPAHVDTERLSWEDAWGLMTPNWFGHTTGNWGPWNDYVGREFETGGTKDTRMQAICTATKNNDVIVYTIGYDIAENGNAEVQLESCASSLNHYYPTDGANISNAFSSIASNVKNLRLTQ